MVLSKQLWHALRERLRGRIPSEDYPLWVEPLVPQASPGDKLLLACPNALHLAMVRERYLAMMREELAELAPGRELSLVLRAATPAAPRQLELPHQSFAPPLLNRRFIFDRFVAGTGNELACAAAKAMAQGSRLFSSTLFLVSGTGLGKSHLTQAVGHQVLAASPGARVAYLTAEEFTNQMIAALRHKRIEAFKERYRRDCDLLLLEEVQFLAGKDKTQDELGYTLDALLDAGKRVVFTSPQPACQIKGLKSALQSRLSGGVTVAIDPPDQRTRLRILERMAADEGVRVAPPVLEYLASEVVGDVRRLQSALLGCLAQGSLGNRTLDLGLAAEVLGQLNLRLKRLSPEAIRDHVAQATAWRSACWSARAGPGR